MSVIDKTAGLFLVFLTISGGGLEDILPCQVRRIFNHHIAKLVLGFMATFFFVGLTDDEDIGNNFVFSLLLYIAFILSSKSVAPSFFTFYGIIFVLYILRLIKTQKRRELENLSPKREGDRQMYEKLENRIELVEFSQTILFYVAIAVLLAGFFYYLYKQYVEKGADFTLLKFFLAECPDIGGQPSPF